MIGTDIQLAKKYLEEGKLVAIPTETVYGLAANALNPKAVARIFEAKKRPTFDPLIVHTSSINNLSDLINRIPLEAKQLGESFWAGPLTLVLEKREIIPDIVTSGLPTVGVRIPNHPLTLELLDSIDFPLSAPSANPFGYVSPTTAQHVAESLGDEVAYILDGGACKVGIESTIVGFPEGKPTIYRKGGISPEDIESVIGKVAIQTHSSSNPSAPGMLAQHYSPNIPLKIGNIETLISMYDSKDIGILSFQKNYTGIAKENQFILSPTGDLNEAAHQLFHTLRLMDKKDLKVILAELVPEVGLGVAINDRLTRAAAKRGNSMVNG